MNWWQNLSEAQATVISGILTCLAALGGVLLAWRLFSAKVKDLTGALEESQLLLNDHRDAVATTLAKIGNQLTAVDAQVSSTLESVGRIGATVGDLDSAQSAPEATARELDRRDQLRTLWFEIRDHLEALAARADIDGRTRAKYGRIDRRSYGSLIDAMEWDGNLPSGASFRNAVALWHRFRNGRNTPTAQEVTAMDYLRSQILSGPAAA